MKSRFLYSLILLMFFSCKKNENTASVIATLPQQDLIYLQGDTVLVSAKGISPNDISKLDIRASIDNLDSLLTSVNGGSGREVYSDTIQFIVNDSLQDSLYIGINYTLFDSKGAKTLTRNLLYLTTLDSLIALGTWDLYHFNRGSQNSFDHQNLVVADYDENLDDQSRFIFVDISKSSDSLLLGLTSPANLRFANISGYNTLDHRSIQTAYYEGQRTDTLYAVEKNSEFVTYQLIGDKNYFTAFKIDSVYNNGVPTESFYRFQVKQYVK